MLSLIQDTESGYKVYLEKREDTTFKEALIQSLENISTTSQNPDTLENPDECTRYRYDGLGKTVKSKYLVESSRRQSVST
uniref:Uncharacterized protein n=1 Tax=Arundo donax TaxID=35708 RepID=A0A0A9D262_ARUDO